MFEMILHKPILRRPASMGVIPAIAILFGLSLVVDVHAQKADSPPAVVQPGAPGMPSRSLPPSTRAQLPPISQKDVEFMQGMITHHAQAVEMTALIADRTTNKEIRSLGSRISHSQADEMRFMERWLAQRGHPIASTHSASMHGMDMAGHDMHSMSAGHVMMPGMLTPEQMEALKNAKGAEFDRLFLRGMIQHHKGALDMVEVLFNAPGTGQDAELFNFATDVDSGQRAEIKIMETMLAEKP